MFSARRRRKKIQDPNSGRSKRFQLIYIFHESVLYFQPAAGGKKFEALIVAAIGGSS